MLKIIVIVCLTHVIRASCMFIQMYCWQNHSISAWILSAVVIISKLYGGIRTHCRSSLVHSHCSCVYSVEFFFLYYRRYYSCVTYDHLEIYTFLYKRFSLELFAFVFEYVNGEQIVCEVLFTTCKWLLFCTSLLYCFLFSLLFSCIGRMRGEVGVSLFPSPRC